MLGIGRLPFSVDERFQRRDAAASEKMRDLIGIALSHASLMMPPAPAIWLMPAKADAAGIRLLML